MARTKDESKILETATAVADACKLLSGVVTVISKFRNNVAMVVKMAPMIKDGTSAITKALDTFNAAMANEFGTNKPAK